MRAAALVLVVEDDPLQALDAEQILAQAGFAPALALDPAAAALAAETGPAAAVVDLDFGVGFPDGRELVRRLRALRPGLPVVVVTSYAPQSPQADLRGVGGPTARVAKPFPAEDLLQALEDVLARREDGTLPRRRSGERAGLPGPVIPSPTLTAGSEPATPG